MLYLNLVLAVPEFTSSTSGDQFHDIVLFHKMYESFETRKLEDKEKLYNFYFQCLHHKTLLCVLHSFDNLC